MSVGLCPPTDPLVSRMLCDTRLPIFQNAYGTNIYRECHPPASPSLLGVVGISAPSTLFESPQTFFFLYCVNLRRAQALSLRAVQLGHGVGHFCQAAQIFLVINNQSHANRRRYLKICLKSSSWSASITAPPRRFNIITQKLRWFAIAHLFEM